MMPPAGESVGWAMEGRTAAGEPVMSLLKYEEDKEWGSALQAFFC